MKSKSLNRLAWQKLKKNRLSFFSLVYILFIILIGAFAAVVSPDTSPNANEMHIELATKHPFAKVLFIEIPKKDHIDISFVQSIFFGSPSKVKRVPIDSFKPLDNGIEYFPYNSEMKQTYIGDYIISEQTFWFGTDRFGRDPKGIQLKINSGEIGIAIGQIPNETIKRRVIQNLYNAASSIGVFKGLNKEERDIIGSAGLNQTTNALRADFVGGIHVKIF